MRYRTKTCLLGLPLIDVAFGASDGSSARAVAKGWIAIGDVAYGVLLSAGGFAAGGIAIGGVSVGVLTIGGVALGAFAIGGLAIGRVALGGLALALHAAYGGVAVAGEYSAGAVTFGPHANDELARNYFDHAPWAPVVAPMIMNGGFVLGAGIVAATLYGISQRKRRAP